MRGVQHLPWQSTLNSPILLEIQMRTWSPWWFIVFYQWHPVTKSSVAGGNWTKPNGSDIYSGVVSNEGSSRKSVFWLMKQPWWWIMIGRWLYRGGGGYPRVSWLKGVVFVCCGVLAGVLCWCHVGNMLLSSSHKQLSSQTNLAACFFKTLHSQVLGKQITVHVFSTFPLGEMTPWLSLEIP